MNLRLLAISLLFLLCVALPAAAQQFLEPSVSSTSVDAVDDLQTLVVLCATQPGSSTFTQAWTTWLRGHPRADVEDTIALVLRRANATGSMTRGFASPDAYHVDDRRIAEHMRATARSVRLTR